MAGKKYLRAVILVFIIAALAELFGVISIPWLFIPSELKIIIVLFLIFVGILVVEFIG